MGEGGTGSPKSDSMMVDLGAPRVQHHHPQHGKAAQCESSFFICETGLLARASQVLQPRSSRQGCSGVTGARRSQEPCHAAASPARAPSHIHGLAETLTHVHSATHPLTHTLLYSHLTSHPLRMLTLSHTSAHTHTHTHTHPRALAHSRARSQFTAHPAVSCSHSATHVHSPTRAHSHSHTHSRAHSHTRAHANFPSHTLSPTLARRAHAQPAPPPTGRDPEGCGRRRGAPVPVSRVPAARTPLGRRAGSRPWRAGA